MHSRFGKSIGAVALTAGLAVAAPPLSAQQAAPGANAAPERSMNGGAAVSDATVQRTGAALRDISGIQARFSQRMQGSEATEQDAIAKEATGEAEAALAKRGLTVEEYTGIIRLAQADQGLRERLIAAARGAQ